MASSLPEDVLLRVFACLPPRGLAASACTCQYWRRLAERPALWQEVLAGDQHSWPILHFQESCLRGGRPKRIAARQAEMPWPTIWRQREELPRCVIVDAGSGYCKFGWSDCDSPSGRMNTFLEFGNILAPMFPMTPRLKDLYNAVYTNLQANSANQPIIISEPVCYNEDSQPAQAAQRIQRETTCDVLFNKLSIPAVCAVDEAVLALYAAHRITGIVVNIGFRLTTIVPVVHGRVLKQVGVSMLGVGAMRITGLLSELMEGTGIRYNSMFTVRTLKEKLCYVAQDVTAEFALDTSATCNLGEEGTFTLSEQRFMAPEILFQPRQFGINCDGLHEAVAVCVEKCAQIEEALGNLPGTLSTIVLAGGTAALPGLAERLQSEARRRVRPELRSSLQVLPGAHSAWEGARMISKTSTFPTAWCVTREQYLRDGPNVLHAMASGEPCIH